MTQFIFKITAVILFLSLGLAPLAHSEDDVSIYFSPSQEGNHQPLIDAINASQSSVKMVIFHINDRAVEKALIDAVSRGVRVQVIVDRLSLLLPPFMFSKRRLTKGGVEVIKSTKGFRISHQKSCVIDNRIAFVTSMNLTNNFDETRDWGVITRDPLVIAEMNRVFDTDLENSQSGQGNTPSLENPHLLWSPVNAEQRLVALIQSAKKTIIAQVENLGNESIQTALEEAAQRGIDVRLISPLCDMNIQADLNVPFSKAMFKKGVRAHLMPGPETPERPYMHSKMMVADSHAAYVGSINFSDNSLRNSREAGIIFSNEKAIATMTSEFEKDWSHTLPPTTETMPACSRNANSINQTSALPSRRQYH